MTYKITTVVKLDCLLEPDTLEEMCDEIIDVIDAYVHNAPRSFYVNTPTDAQLQRHDYVYRVIAEVEYDKVDAHELYNLISKVQQILLVSVADKRFEQRTNQDGYYWTNEGETWYHDSEKGYKDPFYRFHVNGNEEYRIVYLPYYVNENSYMALRKAINDNIKFSWECTGSWNNWMKATTIEEAIEEFEKIYEKKLWASIEGYRERLSNAIESYSNFDKYRKNR